MIIFVDASALVALIRREPESAELLGRMTEYRTRITSAVARWEAARAVAQAPDRPIADAEREVDRLLAAFGIDTVPIGEAEATEAVLAHARYGKGTGHPARLNMGDCFAYACARTNNARLLYKGDDFSRTDMTR